MRLKIKTVTFTDEAAVITGTLQHPLARATLRPPRTRTWFVTRHRRTRGRFLPDEVTCTVYDDQHNLVTGELADRLVTAAAAQAVMDEAREPPDEPRNPDLPNEATRKPDTIYGFRGLREYVNGAGDNRDWLVRLSPTFAEKLCDLEHPIKTGQELLERLAIEMKNDEYGGGSFALRLHTALWRRIQRTFEIPTNKRTETAIEDDPATGQQPGETDDGEHLDAWGSPHARRLIAAIRTRVHGWDHTYTDHAIKRHHRALDQADSAGRAVRDMAVAGRFAAALFTDWPEPDLRTLLTKHEAGKPREPIIGPDKKPMDTSAGFVTDVTRKIGNDARKRLDPPPTDDNEPIDPRPGPLVMPDTEQPNAGD